MLKRFSITSITVITVLLMTFGVITTVHADSFAKAKIPVRYEVTNGAEVDSTFTLKAKGNAPMPEGSVGGEKNVKLTSSGNVDFGEISFGSADLYEYTVSKTTVDLPGMTKDESVHNVYIMVTTAGEVSVIIKKDGTEEKPDEIVYQDAVMIVDPICQDDPPVLKKVQGRDDVTDEFTFELKAMGEDSPMPEGVSGKSMTITAKPYEEKEFGTITFKKEGVYKYQIREVNDGKYDCDYDSTVYDVTYTVTRDGNEMNCKREVSVGGKEVSIAVFEFLNIYKEDITPTPTKEPSIPEKITHSKIYKNTIGKVVNTGDSFNPVIMIVMFLIALGGIGVFAIMRRREKKETEK